MNYKNSIRGVGSYQPKYSEIKFKIMFESTEYLSCTIQVHLLEMQVWMRNVFHKTCRPVHQSKRLGETLPLVYCTHAAELIQQSGGD